MHVLFAAILCLIVSACASSVPNGGTADASIEKLIDDLTLIDSPAPGLHSTANVDDFIADDAPPQFGCGIIGSEAPVISPPMRELVRRGPASLPALIRHLDDRRPTKFSVGFSFKDGLEGGAFLFMSQSFASEYDPKSRTRSPMHKQFEFGNGKPLQESYTLRVGDICFALIGQIVNRELLAVRYQPTANLIVNSPLESRELLLQTRLDWGSTDAAGLKESLLNDLHGEFYDLYFPALIRLRFYYPEAYANLTGLDLKKRLAFENQELADQKAAAREQANADVPLNQGMSDCRTLDRCLEVLGANIQSEQTDLDVGQGEVASKLREFGEAAKQELLKRATHPDRKWRGVSLLTLERWDSLSASDFPSLLEAFRMGEFLAAYPIARIDSPVAVELLVHQLEIRNGNVSVALSRVGPKVLPHLFRVLQSDDQLVLFETVSTIRNMRIDAAPEVEVWTRLAIDTRTPRRERLAAMRGLSGMVTNAPRIRELVAPLRGDSDPAIAQLARQIAGSPPR